MCRGQSLLPKASGCSAANSKAFVALQVRLVLLVSSSTRAPIPCKEMKPKRRLERSRIPSGSGAMHSNVSASDVDHLQAIIALKQQ